MMVSLSHSSIRITLQESTFRVLSNVFGDDGVPVVDEGT